ncbi:MAG: exodeoxyribonuclease VII large subunit [Nocardioidaceae bacterium]|nr:MAG: exodeoxyribonuclease VII large subunit [Nocardioidaceae bacterium]
MALQTSAENPAPVRTIANLISGYIDRLGTVWVEGQIAQLSRRQGMATVFLTLRDSVADVSVTLTAPRQLFDSLNPPLIEGASVVVLGKPRYYANRGTLSLAVTEIRTVGLGDLLARIEQRRQLLAAEGLFDRALKHTLPFLPHAIGLITAHNSAAERDVLQNTRRRWPQARFVVGYAAMQGTNAVREVVEQLRTLDRDPEVDVIVVARGGGSVEDLLPFSDETLIREVAACRTPIVSAIGHEPDTPLLDLVADARASTPTDAAKLIVPDVAQERAQVEQARDRVRGALQAMLDRESRQLADLRDRPVLADPGGELAALMEHNREVLQRARNAVRQRIDRAADDIDHRLARVRALSPQATLRRGYAVVQTPSGGVVTEARQLGVGAKASVVLAEGSLDVTVERIESRADVELVNGKSDG